MIIRAIKSCRDRRPQRRLTGPNLGTAQPAGRQPAAAVQVVAETQPLDLVATKRNDKRAAVAKIDVVSGLRLEFAAELRPLALALKRQREKIVRSRLVFGRRRKHAGCGKARPGTRRRAVEHGDGKARATQDAKQSTSRSHRHPITATSTEAGTVDRPRAEAVPRRRRPVARASCRLVPSGVYPASKPPLPSSGGDFRHLVVGAISNPYAGANRVRFKGFPRCPMSAGQRFLSPLSGISLERTLFNVGPGQGSRAAFARLDS